jgi:hypothetical protein
MSKYDYPYVRAWGQMMHSAQYFIEDQIALARRENAPGDAMWRGIAGKWHRFCEMKPQNPNKALVAAYAKGNENETV